MSSEKPEFCLICKRPSRSDNPTLIEAEVNNVMMKVHTFCLASIDLDEYIELEKKVGRCIYPMVFPNIKDNTQTQEQKIIGFNDCLSVCIKHKIGSIY